MTYTRGANTDDTNTSEVAAAVAAAAAADVVIAVLGDSGKSCGEGYDRDSLDLPGGQLVLLEELAALGKPLVLVLVNGRTATFGGRSGNGVLANVSAVLVAWRPGQEGGGAIAGMGGGKPGRASTSSHHLPSSRWCRRPHWHCGARRSPAQLVGPRRRPGRLWGIAVAAAACSVGRRVQWRRGALLRHVQ